MRQGSNVRGLRPGNRSFVPRRNAHVFTTPRGAEDGGVGLQHIAVGRADNARPSNAAGEVRCE